VVGTAPAVPTTTKQIAEDSMSQIEHDPKSGCPEGALNFRDVGGLAAGPGRRIRHGQLFRSDTLQFLTESDVDLLVNRLGVQTEVDLRLGYEVRIEGRGLLGDTRIAYHHLPFVVRSSQQTGTAAPILDGDDPIVRHYLAYLEHSGPSVAGAVRALCGHDVLPAVVHCAAGKDRTGVAIAFALSVAGVTDEHIAGNYAESPENIPLVFARLRTMSSYGDSIDNLPPEANINPPEYMLRFLGEVRARYGGPREWLLSHGLDKQELDRLRQNLTEPVA
jgi:protein-tyrosine phosphatase